MRPTVLQSLISRVGLLTLAAVLSACSTVAVPTREEPVVREQPKPSVASAPSASPPKRPGAYYQDDGPPEQVPPGLLDTPDAEPKVEPYLRGPSKPYTVLDQTFVPITDARPFVQRGAGSWYGRKYHGRKTASGEIYDMFAMTAAHPILPIPSYARVTNLRNNKQVIVRINDRGPFLASRIIDLSYTAALKLDIIRGGSAELEVERLLPDEIARLQAAKRTASGAELAKKPGDDPIASVLPQSVPSDPATKAIEPAFYLQLGAYGDEMNARTMRDRVLTAWPTHLPQPVIVQSGGWYRVHSGPFANRSLAADAARQLQSANQIQTTVVQR
ncbi:MAG: septal ring lytic transglycosylase RlpA family protein [Burkholderiales bacterium]|nr:septal ring lytic transglycosylase RlpA family protein [Burkholderiales bacterium]